MWVLITDTGKTFTEKDCLWPDLPQDVRIAEIRYRDRRGVVGDVHGYDAYGFQRYSLTTPDGQGHPHAGTQILCVLGDMVTVLDINEVTGERDQHDVPRQELTYAPELLRDGVRG